MNEFKAPAGFKAVRESIWEPEEGETLQGNYRGKRTINSRDGSFDVYLIELADGRRFSVKGASIVQAFESAELNTEVFIQYLGEVELSGGRVMKDYGVAFKAPANVKK